MSLENPQETLDLLYAARRDLLSGKLQQYTIGDRTITLFNLNELSNQIRIQENIVASATPVFADMSGVAHVGRFPED